MRKLKANQIVGSAVQKQLDGTSITAVLTAHPTEVQRQTVLGFNRRIHSLLSMRERCTNAEALTDLRREIDTVLLSLWQTSETRHHKISVNDEINQRSIHLSDEFSSRRCPNSTAAWNASFRRPIPTSSSPTS